jgi:hypothetical protein
VLRDVTRDGVDDTDDRVRADLKSQESGLENQEGAVRLKADGLDGVKRYPLRDHGGGRQEKKYEEESDVLISMQKGNGSHEICGTPCTITLF